MHAFAPSRLTRAIRLTLMASALAGVVHAQTAVAQTSLSGQPSSKLSATTTVHINERTLGAALDAWALQTGIQLAYASRDVAAQAPASAVDGTMTAQEALQRLLPTDVGFRVVNANTVMVGSLAAVQSAEAAAQAAAAGTGLQQVEIVGSHLQRDAAPAGVTVIDAEQIARSGYSSIEDVFRALSQAGSGISSAGVALYQMEYGTRDRPASTLGASSINLHGLGSRATLVLVDGRRRTGSAQGAGTYTDISSIPLSQVERIEILSDGASAIYGADAVGGVVNIVLKKNYDGTMAQVRLEKSNLGADMRRLNLAHSFAWDGGTLNLSGQIQRQMPSDLTSRIPIGPDGRGDFTALGGVNTRTPGVGDLGVVYGAQEVPAYPDGPTFLMPTFPMGQVPANAASGPLTLDQLTPVNPAQLPSYYPPLRVGPKNDQISMRLDGEFELGGKQKLEWGLSAGRQRNSERWHPSLADFAPFAVPTPTGFQSLVSMFTTNPNNTFGQQVLVGYSFAKEFELLTLSNDQSQNNIDAHVGLRGPLSFASGWDYEATLTRSQEVSTSTAYTAQGQLMTGDQLVKDVMDALNPLTNGSDPAVIAANAAALQKLLTTRHQNGRSAATTLDGVVRGSLFNTGAGEAHGAFGVQLRDERFARTDDFVTVDVDSSRRVSALFGEVGIPLLKDAPMAQHLGVALAARYEHFSQQGLSALVNAAQDNATGSDLMEMGGFAAPTVFGLPYAAPFTTADTVRRQNSFGNISPSMRLSWSPVKSLQLRASVGRSFLTPTASQLYGFANLTDMTGYRNPTDPPLPTGVTYVVGISGVNNNLKPQVANTKTLGADWVPFQEDHMLHLSFTYNHTRFNNYIGDPVNDIGFSRYLQALMGSATPPPINNGVLLLDARNMNFARRESRSVDLGLGYAVNTSVGDFNVDLNATRMLSLLSQPLASMPVFEFGNSELGPSKWKVNLVTAWTLGEYGVTLGLNHTSAFRVLYPQSAVASLRNPVPNPNPQRTAAGYTTVDAQFAYAPQEGALAGWKLAVGVQNLFDRAYPFVDNGVGFLADRVATRGRVVYLDLSAKF